ncbi:MAG: amidase [Pseudomonadota bacterium]
MLGARTTLSSCVEALEGGALSSAALVEGCLEKIAESAGEGARAFLHVDADRAQLEAKYYDDCRKAGVRFPRFAGIPIAIKGNIDMAGHVTTAGSRVLVGSPPAAQDALVVSRLRAAGFICLGRTNMTEFAYSGLGLNPHYGTPLNPYGRDSGHIPGGSSSGTAVAVADGMAIAGLGTDTGGSCRIPAAWCGLTGFKPSSARVSKQGVYPLSNTLDAVGPIGQSVSCCAALDAVMSGAGMPAKGCSAISPMSLKGLRIAVSKTVMLDRCSIAVARAFERALTSLSNRGAIIHEVAFDSIGSLADVNAKGGFAAAEAYAHLRALLTSQQDAFDPRVASRILRGAEQDAADYIDLTNARIALIADFTHALEPFDCLIAPTVPVQAPTLRDVDDDASYAQLNLLALRNPSVANFFDCPSISTPIESENQMPVGLMIIGKNMEDTGLFKSAAAIEAALAQ